MKQSRSCVDDGFSFDAHFAHFQLREAPQHLYVCVHVACVFDIEKAVFLDLDCFFLLLLNLDLSCGLQFLSDFWFLSKSKQLLLMIQRN